MKNLLKKLSMLAIFMLVLGFTLQNKTAKAYSDFRIEGVASAHMLNSGSNPSFWRPTGYQDNNGQPVTLTTDYPCITTYAANRYVYQYIWIDGVYRYQLGDSQKTFYMGLTNLGAGWETSFALHDLTPGRHNIKIIAGTISTSDTMTDDITVVLP